tara:strand:- start:11709 stop:11855 length:147 start_codon:yes stop_codon:yes gene_type:complete
MSLLKNILIVGLFLSVFVAVSPAFAGENNPSNEYVVVSKQTSNNLVSV